ncbi:hypothetical protein CLOAM0202 [Candidatus Cloacimonas acidaminovorans str. Evry]|uniref:Uncharacterized protein n=1 Tax=Cloacimonas acidaminovorans (strain Evry) TaxID=459349 RepID=B0VF59_CLOAI|nr:hypothetical protein CLOAM0202 [Candidatus Cloacimonas acidaminovorans str. Evry]
MCQITKEFIMLLKGEYKHLESVVGPKTKILYHIGFGEFPDKDTLIPEYHATVFDLNGYPIDPTKRIVLTYNEYQALLDDPKEKDKIVNQLVTQFDL